MHACRSTLEDPTDALTPHKAAIHRLTRAARRDLGLACALNRIVGKTQMWMLAAAGIGHRGLVGALKIQGSVLVYTQALNVWVDDEDPGLARTMAALDRGLRRGEQALQWLDRACSLVPRFGGRQAKRDSGRRVEV